MIYMPFSTFALMQMIAHEIAMETLRRHGGEGATSSTIINSVRDAEPLGKEGIVNPYLSKQATPTTVSAEVHVIYAFCVYVYVCVCDHCHHLPA